ncbi:MAG TPA: SDR family NAD(P)-dependent oxidoreductase [Streptosporangiaceae bacterium]|nr:SDR family NAD(P)-dependent oxidoreductase [Streptosporangiaceae bacterium]
MAALAGKVALVTGGASGIGAGIAQVLAQAGASVAIGDLDEAGAVDLARQLPGEAKRLGVRLDVTGRQSTDDAVGRIEHELGPVDVLVNNAGVSSVTPFAQITDAEWTRLFEVNLRGVLVVTQRVLTPMVERRSGRIINISSMAGKEGLPNLAHYCATKFGVIGLTQSLAKEVAAFDVTVNAVCPGVVRTPLWDDPDTGILRDLDGENGWNAFVGGIPLGRPQSAEDIGHACAYLASDAAANITGEALNVSGGQQMH